MHKRQKKTITWIALYFSMRIIRHFATFPPKLITPCILASSPPGGTILDPFAGAGTTGLVAEALGRNAILIELNPAYVAMAQQRIAEASRGNHA